jgi:hypothetical protein
MSSATPARSRAGCRPAALFPLLLALLATLSVFATTPQPGPAAGQPIVAGPTPAAAAILETSDCLACHDEVSVGTLPARKSGAAPAVHTGLLGKSVHAKLACTACHADIADVPHADKLAPAQCASCHEAEGKAYASSIHGVSHLMGASDAASCKDCHGGHDILPVGSPSSPVLKFNLPRTCAKCHSNPGLAAEYQMPRPEAASHYMESIHGKALLQGLAVAPSCNDCHGVHDIRRSVDKASHTNHQNIAHTCGHCHVGVEQVYNTSIHGQLLAAGDKRGPVCSDCHSAHDIEHPVSAHFKAGSDQSCGKCHQDRLAHYRDTYHGKAMALGRPNVAADVAACYDCHGHHDVLPVSDPRSRLSSSRIVGTCQQCHPGVGASFAKYQPHANPLDSVNYPILNKVFVFMTILLVGTFAFFGIHTLFWLVRSIYLFLHDSRQFLEAKVTIERDEEWFTRFTPFERFLHMMVVTSFLLLTITGMPLKFYYTAWAHSIFELMGGADVAARCTTSGPSSPSPTSPCTWAPLPSRCGGAALRCAIRPAAAARCAGSSVRCSVPIRCSRPCRTGATS